MIEIVFAFLFISFGLQKVVGAHFVILIDCEALEFFQLELLFLFFNWKKEVLLYKTVCDAKCINWKDMDT